MDFGLGLVLSFTDNASSGINNAVNSLNLLTTSAEGAMSSLDSMASLASLSAVSSQLGSSFTSMGNSVLGTIQSVLNRVNATGSDFQAFGLTLNKLFGDEEAAANAMEKLLDFSIKSPFEVGEVKDMLIVLKSQGIDAFEQMTGAASGFSQEALSWIADLMAFKPDEPVQRWKRALTNYLGSAQPLMLRNMLDMGDIPQILGHEMGSTVEERMRDIMEIVEHINLQGYADEMSKTLIGMQSNVDDAMTKIYKVIADEGVFEKLLGSFASLKGAILALDNEQIEALGKAIAGGLNLILTPVVAVTTKIGELIDKIVELAQTRPELVKWGIVFTAIAGAALIGIGVFFKATSALSGLTLLLYTTGNSFSSISALFRTGVLKIMGALIPLTLAIGMMYLVWKNDLFGIRTIVTEFATGVMNSFKTAFTAVNGTLADMQGVLKTFDTQHSFFDGLTLAIMRLMVLGRALVEGWNGFTLSEETWQKARELGILPLIEAIFDLKWRIDHFLAGFKEGFTAVADKVKEFLLGLADAMNGTIFEDMLRGATEFFQLLTNNDPAAWTEVGRVVGDIAAKLVLVAAVVAPLIGVGMKIFGVVKNIIGVVQPLLGLIAAHPVVAIILAVVAALGILYAKSETFRNLVASVFEKIQGVVQDLMLVLMPVIENIITTAQEILPQLLAAFQRIGAAVVPIIENILGLIVQLAPVIMNVVGSALTFIISLLPSVMKLVNTIANILGVVFEIVGEVIDMVVPFLVDLFDQLGTLIADILPVITDLIDNVVEAVTHTLDLVLPMLKQTLQALMPIIKVILNIVTMIVSRLIPVIKSIITIVSNVIKAVIDVVMPIITVVVQVVQAIINVLSPIVEVILQAAGFIIDLILGVVQVLVSAVNMAVGLISGLINFIMGIINTIVQFIMMVVAVIVGVVQVIIDTICGIIGGIIGFVQGVWDGIVGVFSGALDFFSGVFSSIFEVISGVFTDIGDFFVNVWDTIVTTFATLGDTISGAIKGAVNSVIGGAVGIINGFIKAINFAIGIINAIPGVNITKLTLLDVPQLAKGGVVDSPTVAMIGEQGKEAVVPLENNTDWIDTLSDKLGKTLFNTTSNTGSPILNVIAKANDTNVTVTNDAGLSNLMTRGNAEEQAVMTPVSNSTSNTSTTNNTANSFITNNNTSNAPVNTQDDHSVTFEAGSIVLNVQNASEAEARRFAKMIMEMIKQEQRVEDTMHYNK